MVGFDVGKHGCVVFGRNRKNSRGRQQWFSVQFLYGGAGRMDCELVIFKRWRLIIGGLPDKAYPASPAA